MSKPKTIKISRNNNGELFVLLNKEQSANYQDYCTLFNVNRAFRNRLGTVTLVLNEPTKFNCI